MVLPGNLLIIVWRASPVKSSSRVANQFRDLGFSNVTRDRQPRPLQKTQRMGHRGVVTMFEYINRKRDPITIALYLGAAPFAIAWVLHNSIWTAFALEAFLITMEVFVINPVELQGEKIRQRGYWKGMILSGMVLHPLFLGSVWFLDSKYPVLIRGTGTLFFVAIMVGALESVTINPIAARLQPKNGGTS
jgi:hypothetical protein